MTVIPVGEWTPDQPDFQNPGAAVVQNVYPRTQTSYGPFPGLASQTIGLNNRCQGGFGVRYTDGTSYLFAGDSTKLYFIQASSTSWNDVSLAGGYNISATDQWKWTLFYNNVIAVNIADAPQSYIIGSSTKFANLSSGAPKATYVGMVRDFCVLGNTNDGTNGVRPQRVWWSAIGDPTNFPTPGTSSAAAVQSDYQDVSGDFGWLQGIVPNVGPVDALLFFQGAVFRMMYIGAPDIFSILPAHGIKGCFAPGSIVNTELGVFYLTPDGFVISDGVNVYPVGYGKVDKWFFSNVDISNYQRISAVLDPNNPIVWVSFPSTSAIGGTPDTIIGCNFRLQSSVGGVGRWCQVPSLNHEILFRGISLGYTLDQLDTFGNLDTLPASLDSQVWQGTGQFLFGAFDPSHVLNYFTGSNLAPLVETTESEIFPGHRARISRAIPLVDGGTPTLQPGTRNLPTASVSYGAAVSANSEGFCPLNAEGRFHRMRVSVPANTTFNHLKGVLVPDEFVSKTGTR